MYSCIYISYFDPKFHHKRKVNTGVNTTELSEPRFRNISCYYGVSELVDVISDWSSETIGILRIVAQFLVLIAQIPPFSNPFSLGDDAKKGFYNGYMNIEVV